VSLIAAWKPWHETAAMRSEKRMAANKRRDTGRPIHYSPKIKSESQMSWGLKPLAKGN
jgi:hypothetical protein